LQQVLSEREAVIINDFFLNWSYQSEMLYWSYRRNIK
jgi:hypothetical protein